MFGVGWMETEEYHGYSTPQAGVDSNMGVFKADMKDLIGYANGTYEGKICRGCRKGKEQLEEEVRYNNRWDGNIAEHEAETRCQTEGDPGVVRGDSEA